MTHPWYAQRQRSGVYVVRPKRQVGFTQTQDQVNLDVEPPDDGGEVYAVASDWVEPSSEYEDDS